MFRYGPSSPKILISHKHFCLRHLVGKIFYWRPWLTSTYKRQVPKWGYAGNLASVLLFYPKLKVWSHNANEKDKFNFIKTDVLQTSCLENNSRISFWYIVNTFWYSKSWVKRLPCYTFSFKKSCPVQKQ